MFSKIFTSLLLVAALTAGVVAKPVPKNRLSMSRRTDSHSLSSWGGISSLDGFDNFYGVGNYDGSQHFSQTIIQEKQLVCHRQQIEIIQQRLVVLQEMAKKIITETVCEVETQTIVFEQFHSGLGSFSHDLRRLSGHQVGYDSNIVSHFSNMVNSDGSLNLDNWGFNGQDVGGHTVVVSGNNWVNSSSPVSVSNAYNAARDAYLSLHPEISSTSPSSVIPTNVVPVPSTVVPSNALPHKLTPLVQ
ncbi:hypothetical protein LshimejAT787_0502130 [Lyophyllum shimeji]|uniref:Uncharacterized protein n=1 Tax=Lyophyllum shimeji TaxID=47721 RepID=A0A9P3UM61_LYOSH|nr:hypothetical protein LshimejAT787_0502130 [Lyophyllum shimeji]